MANPDRREEAEAVEVRVLCDFYGSARNPLGRKGDVIKVPREEYESHKGSVSALSGKITGASLRLVSDEKKAEARVTNEQKKKEDLHFARREQFRAQQRAARDAELIRAENDAKAAAERVKQLKAK